MIPFNPSIFIYLFIFDLILWITPLFILMTLAMVVRIFYVTRKDQLSLWKRFFKRKVFAGLTIIVLVITGILSVISYDIIQLKLALSALDSEEFYATYEARDRRQKMRQNFVLEQDHLYGEFLFPKGTLINRNDPSDSGDEDYPLILSGFIAAQFKEPIEFAGVLTTKISARGLVELAEDQRVGPPHYYSSKYGKYGGWVEDRTTPTMFCPKGSVALFEKPSGPGIDLDDEFWWKEKDGAEAHFKPSEWQFRYCNNHFTVDIKPAYGTDEAMAIENAERAKKAEADKKPQTVIRDGVLMDAEPVEFTVSYFLEGMREYHFGVKKGESDDGYAEAYQLFLKAADNGEEDAYYYLGTMNYYGQGTPKDIEKSLYWLNKAVEVGSSDAIGIIGRIYFEDESMQDYAQALALFEKGTEQGNLTAEFYLGWMYTQGLGVEQDYEQALVWFKKAAHPLHAAGMTGYNQLAIDAMENIGQIYEKGLLGEVDLKSALPWYEKACYLDSESACQSQKEIESQNKD